MNRIARFTCLLVLGGGLLSGAPVRAQTSPAVASGPAGVYSITVPSTAKISWGLDWWRIDWSVGPDPVPPGPDPVPPAPVPPAPVTGKLFVTLVLDESKTTQELVIMRTALSTTDWKPYNAAFHTYLSTQSELTTLRMDGLAKAAGYPCVFVQSQTEVGKPAPIVSTLKAPLTAASVIQAVKDLRGIK